MGVSTPHHPGIAFIHNLCGVAGLFAASPRMPRAKHCFMLRASRCHPSRSLLHIIEHAAQNLLNYLSVKFFLPII